MEKFKIKITDFVKLKKMSLLSGDANRIAFTGTLSDGKTEINIAGFSPFEKDIKTCILMTRDNLNKKDVLGKTFIEIP